MPSDRAVNFVDFIVKSARDNPGCRADLRSGLGRHIDDAPRMHGYLVRFTSPSAPHARAVLYTVASLVAVNVDDVTPTRSPGSLGASIARAAHIALNTQETTVHMLTRQPASQLPRALTRTILPLRDNKKDTVQIDFARLIDDAISWPTRRKQIGSRWLQDYYRTTLDIEKALDAL